MLRAMEHAPYLNFNPPVDVCGTQPVSSFPLLFRSFICVVQSSFGRACVCRAGANPAIPPRAGRSLETNAWQSHLHHSDFKPNHAQLPAFKQGVLGLCARFRQRTFIWMLNQTKPGFTICRIPWHLDWVAVLPASTSASASPHSAPSSPEQTAPGAHDCRKKNREWEEKTNYSRARDQVSAFLPRPPLPELVDVNWI